MRNITILLILMLHSPAFAGDEDMNPTAYSVFDPVTGYMIPADQLPPQEHTSTATTTNETTIPDESSTMVGQPMASESSTNEDQSPMWMYLVAGALILGGFAAWVRNKGKISNSNLD
ncbi:MAG: hypothetical protein HKN08_10135 [Gammaproteobacteria bacterium]|nr:hypothetical protein [Gammaproteobacteria bacterium]